MTALYNLIFLLQTRVAKVMRGEKMDEELFRGYFIRLYKGIRHMESRFKALMEEDELDTFVRFSRAMVDLAEIFKI